MTETEVKNNLPSGIEEIADQGKLIAMIVRAEYQEKGIIFFTKPIHSLQFGQMTWPAGHEIPPHIHLPVPREVVYTNEVLNLIYGKVLVDFYNDEKKPVGQTILKTGDTLYLVSGGHGFKMLEETKMSEVKQGPYVEGKDKERFKKP